MGQHIDYLGIPIIITAKSVGYYGSFLNGKPYEEDILRRFVTDIPLNGIVLDIGACTGSYAMLDLIRPDCQIYAFEPSRVYEELVKNVKNNGSKTICRRVALGAVLDIAEFNEVIADMPVALSMLGGVPSANKQVQKYMINVTTIDRLNLKPSIIKIDVEGSELMVLQGGEKTIRELHPIIYAEYSQENANQYGYECTEIAKLLVSWGYIIEIIGDNLIAKWEN